jgi:hypothetical protein
MTPLPASRSASKPLSKCPVAWVGVLRGPMISTVFGPVKFGTKPIALVVKSLFLLFQCICQFDDDDDDDDDDTVPIDRGCELENHLIILGPFKFDAK